MKVKQAKPEDANLAITHRIIQEIIVDNDAHNEYKKQLKHRLKQDLNKTYDR
jgi:hypothetical protein